MNTMIHVKLIFWGVVVAVIETGVVASILTVLSGAVLHGFFENFPRVFVISLPFDVIGMVILGVSVARVRRTWVVHRNTLLVAYGSSVAAAFLGNGVWIAFHLNSPHLSVNWSELAAWCWIYGLALLPLMYPLYLTTLRAAIGSRRVIDDVGHEKDGQ